MRRRLLLAAAAAATLVIAIPDAGARVRTVRTPERDVSATPNLAEGEATVAYNPRDRRNVIVGSNQWQPLTGADSEDYVGLGPSGFTRCAAWSSADGGRSWHGGPMMDDVYKSVPLREFDR